MLVSYDDHEIGPRALAKLGLTLAFKACLNVFTSSGFTNESFGNIPADTNEGAKVRVVSANSDEANML